MSEQSHQLTFNPNLDLLPVKYSSLAPGGEKEEQTAGWGLKNISENLRVLGRVE